MNSMLHSLSRQAVRYPRLKCSVSCRSISQDGHHSHRCRALLCSERVDLYGKPVVMKRIPFRLRDERVKADMKSQARGPHKLHLRSGCQSKVRKPGLWLDPAQTDPVGARFQTSKNRRKDALHSRRRKVSP